MPTYTEFSAFNTGDLLTATHMNNIVGNIEYLVAGVYEVQEPATAADYTTTGTSFSDVDATEWDVDIDTTADATGVLVRAQFVAQNTSTNSNYYELTRDGSALGGGANGIVDIQFPVGNQDIPVTLEWLDTGITPGNSHSYRLQHKVSAGTGAIKASSVAYSPLFTAKEVH
jgi:hypothetical protein